MTSAGVGPSARAAAADIGQLPAVDDRWVHYQSPNFELFSHQDEGTSRAMLHDLELLRAVFVERFHFVERARLEVTVYSFRTKKDFQAYSTFADEKRAPISGFYLPQTDRAVIVLAPTEDRDEARHLVFHEYVHHLFRAAESDPPVWFNEGMAELLAGIRVEGETVQFGHPVVGRLLSLRDEKLLSLETLFATGRNSALYRNAQHTGLFYAQSWALLHYWYCGKSDISAEAVTRFLEGATGEEKMPPGKLPAFFHECFGMDYGDMVKRVERYVRSGRYSYATKPLPALASARSYAARAVSTAEIHLRLAELAVRVNRSPLGQVILAQATFNPSSDPRPYELLGALATNAGDSVLAAEHWEKAVAAGSTNRAILRELALIEGRTWFREFNYDLKIPVADADRLRTRLLRSIEHEPLQSASYEMLAWVEAFAEKRSIANINLVQRNFNNLPKKARTLVALAMVRVRTGAPAEALKLLQPLNQLDPDLRTAQAAEVISATLEDRPVQRLVDEAKGAQEVRSELTPEIKTQRRLPSVPLPDDL